MYQERDYLFVDLYGDLAELNCKMVLMNHRLKAGNFIPEDVLAEMKGCIELVHQIGDKYEHLLKLTTGIG